MRGEQCELHFKTVYKQATDKQVVKTGLSTVYFKVFFL